jgi:hypothetical protein
MTGRLAFERVMMMAGTPTVSEPVAREVPARRRAPLPLAATVTTIWAALVSYLPVVVLVSLLTGHFEARVGTGAWLLAHGVALSTPAGRFGLVPLGVSVLAAWRLGRAGVHTGRATGARTPASALLAGAAVAVVYGALGALAAGLTGGLATPVRAGLTMGGFAFTAAAIGALAGGRVLRRAMRRLPPVVRDGLRTGTVAALLVLGAGAAAAGVAVAISGGQASATLASYRTGVVGQAGVMLLCLVYAPNIATWSAAYLIGPGFAVGAGTAVSAGHVRLGALPAVPVLAGLPDSAVSGAGPLLLGLPMAGGMVAGWLLVRRRLRLAARQELPAPGWAGLLGAAALAGPVAGGLLGLAAAVSGGPLGSGRLAVTGPSPLPVAVVGTLVVAVGAVLAGAGTRTIGRAP